RFDRATEAGADRVDENQVRLIEQRILIVHRLVRRRERAAVLLEQDAPRPEQSHVQPDGRGAGTAVERKSDWTLRQIPRVVPGVSDVENGRGRFVLIVA